MEDRLLKRNEDSDIGEHIERVCHYPKYREGDAPCFGCVKRTECNHDIFSRLADYEDTNLSPEEIRKAEDIASSKSNSRLTISNSDGSVSQPTATTVESVFRKLADYEDIGIEPDALKELISILRKG